MPQRERHLLQDYPPIAIWAAQPSRLDASSGPIEFDTARLSLGTDTSMFEGYDLTHAVYIALGLPADAVAQITHYAKNTVNAYHPALYDRLRSRATWGEPASARSNMARFLLAEGVLVVDRPLSPPLHLAPRAKQLFQLVCQGMSGPDAANALGIAEKTFKSYWKTVAQTSHWQNREQLIMAAFLSGHLDPLAPGLPAQEVVPNN